MKKNVISASLSLAPLWGEVSCLMFGRSEGSRRRRSASAGRHIIIFIIIKWKKSTLQHKLVFMAFFKREDESEVWDWRLVFILKQSKSSSDKTDRFHARMETSFQQRNWSQVLEMCPFIYCNCLFLSSRSQGSIGRGAGSHTVARKPNGEKHSFTPTSISDACS